MEFASWQGKEIHLLFHSIHIGSEAKLTQTNFSWIKNSVAFSPQMNYTD
jgi:hypothetical protein